MKIVQIVPRFPPSIGGVERHVYEISKELAKRGNQVTVITTNLVNGDTIGTGCSYYSNVLVNRCATNFQVKNVYHISFSLLKKLLKIPADIFHSHTYGEFSSDATALAAKLRDIPLVLTSHGFYRPTYSLSKVVMKIYNSFVGRLVASTASKCIALTQYDAKIWHELGIPTEKIEVVPNGVNLEYYSSPTSHYANVKKYNLNGKAITFIGRLDDVKSPSLMTFIKAFKNSLSDFPMTKLVIIGPDWGYLTKLRNLVISLKMKDSVIFTGAVSEHEKIMFLSESSIGLVLSTQEAFPLTCLEFMAFGKPVIASRVGGLPCVVKDEYNGILINNDQFSMEAALRKLLSAVPYARKMGRNGRELVLSKYNWKSVTDKLEKTYRECVEK